MKVSKVNLTKVEGQMLNAESKIRNLKSQTKICNQKSKIMNGLIFHNYHLIQTCLIQLRCVKTGFVFQGLLKLTNK